MKKRISIMLITILLLQVVLSILNVTLESGITSKSIAATN